MQVIILCGGKGLRLHGSNEYTPKPLALVRGKPILWHIMKHYTSFGYNEFILPLGSNGYMIKEYFINYEWKNYDFTKDSKKNGIILHQEPENWRITFVDTGEETMTGWRIKQIQKYITGDTFMLTYGDGLSDIDINQLLEFHKKNGKIATVTGIERKSQFGIIKMENGIATNFNEKTELDGTINGGYFVLNSKVFDYIPEDEMCSFEQEPMKNLVLNREMAVYIHRGYWAAIDTYKDLLEANINGPKGELT